MKKSKYTAEYQRMYDKYKREGRFIEREEFIGQFSEDQLNLIGKMFIDDYTRLWGMTVVIVAFEVLGKDNFIRIMGEKLYNVMMKETEEQGDDE